MRSAVPVAIAFRKRIGSKRAVKTGPNFCHLRPLGVVIVPAAFITPGLCQCVRVQSILQVNLLMIGDLRLIVNLQTFTRCCIILAIYRTTLLQSNYMRY